MKPRFVGLCIVLLAAAIGPGATPSSGVTQVPLTSRGPGIKGIVRDADSVFILRLDPEPIPRCDWDFTDSLRYTHCYETVETIEAPDAEWTEELGELLARSSTVPWDKKCGYTPLTIIRFVEDDRVSDLIILTGDCDSTRLGLVMIVPGIPMEHRELRTGREDLLDLVARAFSLHDAMQERMYGTVISSKGVFTKKHREDSPRPGEFACYDEAPVPVTQNQPTYPEFAKEAQIQGKVVLHVLVGADGRVANVRIHKGVTGLNEAAVDAVKRWVFRPATDHGNPVPAWIEVPMEFHYSR